VAAASPELPEDHQALRCDALAAGVQQLDQITLIVVIGAVSCAFVAPSRSESRALLPRIAPH